MENVITSNFRLGIIAGGQLGKMLALAASNWDVKTFVLDESSESPAAGVCTHFIQGNYTNFDDVYNFGKQVDMLTFEIENVNVAALYKLQSEGVLIFPEPQVLELIQDKGAQKQFFAQHAILSSPFQLYASHTEIAEALAAGSLRFPFVQKLRTSGYDGRGVAVINGPHEMDRLLKGPSMVEQKIDIAREIAVQVARNRKGETAVFPVVDLKFNEQANLVEFLSCPSVTSEEIQSEAAATALKIITGLNLTGLLAVEFFISTDGKLYVNEISPRAHNSGHHTIESCITSQYEQHLRSIMGFALGSTELRSASVMVNLLGAQGYEGAPRYDGLSECLAIEGTKIHIYGKPRTKPFRKMGHATVLDKSLDGARHKAKLIRDLLKITA